MDFLSSVGLTSNNDMFSLAINDAIEKLGQSKNYQGDQQLLYIELALTSLHTLIEDLSPQQASQVAAQTEQQERQLDAQGSMGVVQPGMNQFSQSQVNLFGNFTGVGGNQITMEIDQIIQTLRQIQSNSQQQVTMPQQGIMSQGMMSPQADVQRKLMTQNMPFVFAFAHLSHIREQLMRQTGKPYRELFADNIRSTIGNMAYTDTTGYGTQYRQGLQATRQNSLAYGNATQGFVPSPGFGQPPVYGHTSAPMIQAFGGQMKRRTRRRKQRGGCNGYSSSSLADNAAPFTGGRRKSRRHRRKTHKKHCKRSHRR